ncbi:hypothetical protein [Methylomicrobium sp. Wu6]|uniref:hypothetical protein n=1 Tax=Methylomicrobium sp. Wu6 TaxID=3107928 RepID=UPI002DD6AA9B|nr:hypothetical protein [Methylomicrobium sp. Wu6]MEC4749224.1 hypothetical protein [Methylomicrobium sp. Wu6]
MKKEMATHKTIRVRGARWEAIEKKAWEFSIKENKVIKPTDIADALLSKYINEITIEDVKEAMEKR